MNKLITLALVIILGISAWFGDFSDAVGKGEDFILPTEKITASKKCEMHDGLAQINTKTTKRMIVFHAFCGDGKKVTWQRG